MIKVIGEDLSQVKLAVCKNCAARLEFTQSDVKERHGKDISGGPDGAEYIECPRCKHEVVLRSW